MIIPNITPLPPSPQRTDPSTFAARADASLTAQETVFTPELNAFASAVNVTQTEMTVLSATATEQAQIATTQAAAAASSALSAGATVWVSGTTYIVGVSRYSPLDGQVYRRMVGGAGTTDPSLDAVNWRVVNGLTSELIVLPFNNLPSMRPSLNLDFANNQSVDPRITFTRASTATRTNNKGLIESVASGVPRIDFDPVTGVCKGLLIEEQRTNLLTYSEQFDNGAWTPSAITISSNTATAPDGSVTADTLTSSGSGYLSPPSAITSGTPYTLSCYVRAGSTTSVSHLFYGASFNSGGGAPQSVFDLVAGTVVDSNTAKGSIVHVGMGWYRCSSTAVATTTTSGNLFQLLRFATPGTVQAWGAQLEAGAFPTTYQPSTETHTGRASTATFFGSNGLIQTASSGVARMNYNPMNLTVQPKLLLEPAGTNLLTYSEQFDNAVWAKVRATISANATTAPDGTLTADKLVEDSSASTDHFCRQSASFTSGTAYTKSIFVKAGERNQVEMWFFATAFGATQSVLFTLTGNGAAQLLAGSATGSITSIGAGWYRCSMTATAAATVIDSVFIRLAASGASYYTGDGSSGLFIWGAQLEASPFPTSYIPTVASQVTRVADTSTSAQTTRAADVASMTGANFSSWYQQDEGSFVFMGRLSAIPSSTAALIGTNIANVNFLLLGSDGALSIDFRSAGGTLTTVATGLTAGSAVNAALAFGKSGAVSYSINGATATTITMSALTLEVISLITILHRTATAITTPAACQSLSYYPKCLTNAELQALSTQ